jgi:hypothetical protein
MKVFGLLSMLLALAVIGFVVANIYKTQGLDQSLNVEEEINGEEIANPTNKPTNVIRKANSAADLLQQHEDLIENEI